MTSTAVYRKQIGKPPWVECMLIAEGKKVSDYHWKWYSPHKQGPSTAKAKSYASEAAAEAEVVAAVATLLADGWTEVSNWPGAMAARPTAPRPAKPEKAKKPKPAKKPKKPKKPKRITLGQLTIRGRVAKVPEAELTALARHVALPADWCQLVRTHGVRMFANLVRITKPAKVLAETKRWAKLCSGDHSPLWTNFAALVPEPSALVMLASTSNGDRVGHSGKRYVVFPRSSDLMVGLADLAELFGYFLDRIEDAEGTRGRPTYQPESDGR